jgi:hypothetical protein
MSEGDITSSWNRIVDKASARSSGRIAARYCLFRITSRPIATFPWSSIAFRRSAYAFRAPSLSSGAR